MKTYESIRTNTTEGVIELGVASVETKGPGPSNEGTGQGVPFIPGISEE